MKYMRSTAAVLCVLLLCVVSMPLTAFAASTTVTVGTTVAKPGDTVTVPVTVSRVENVGGLEVHVQYDTAMLECVEASVGDGASGLMMKNVNTAPVGYPDQVWLTAIGTPTVIDGEVMNITFRVRENAPAGDTALTLATDRLAVLIGIDAVAADVTPVNGKITVTGDQAATSATTVPSVTTQTAKPTTTVGSTPTTAATTVATTSDAAQTPSTTVANSDAPTTTPTVPSGMVAIEDDQGQTVTRVDGEIVTVPSQQTMVDLNGGVVTGVNGEPTMVQAVALMVDELTAKPGDRVTVDVSVSALAEILTVGVGIEYDTKALTFESGEVVGFLKDGMSMAVVTENQKGTVDITAMNTSPVSGNGTIAQLVFTVNKGAYNGSYRLSSASKPFFQTADGELPVQYYAGEIRVEGGKEHAGFLSAIMDEVVIAVVLAVGIPVVLIVAGVTVAIVLIVKKKKKSAQ